MSCDVRQMEKMGGVEWWGGGGGGGGCTTQSANEVEG